LNSIPETDDSLCAFALSQKSEARQTKTQRNDARPADHAAGGSIETDEVRCPPAFVQFAVFVPIRDLLVLVSMRRRMGHAGGLSYRETRSRPFGCDREGVSDGQQTRCCQQDAVIRPDTQNQSTGLPAPLLIFFAYTRIPMTGGSIESDEKQCPLTRGEWVGLLAAGATGQISSACSVSCAVFLYHSDLSYQW